MVGEFILAEAKGEVDFPTGKSGECEWMALLEWSSGWRGDLTEIGLEVRCSDLAGAMFEVDGDDLCKFKLKFKLTSLALLMCRLGSA